MIAAIVSLTTATARTAAVEEKDMAGYLFVYFTGNDISQEAICFALATTDCRGTSSTAAAR